MMAQWMISCLFYYKNIMGIICYFIWELRGTSPELRPRGLGNMEQGCPCKANFPNNIEDGNIAACSALISCG